MFPVLVFKLAQQWSNCRSMVLLDPALSMIAQAELRIAVGGKLPALESVAVKSFTAPCTLIVGQKGQMKESAAVTALRILKLTEKRNANCTRLAS